MIKPITEKPAVFTKARQEGDRFFVCFDDSGEPYAYICLNCRWKPWSVIHLEVTDMSHKHMREAVKRDWPQIVKIAKGKGCHYMLAETLGNVGNTELFRKFISHFGFTKYIERLTSIQEI